jgi:hypothetical protein
MNRQFHRDYELFFFFSLYFHVPVSAIAMQIVAKAWLYHGFMQARDSSPVHLDRLGCSHHANCDPSRSAAMDHPNATGHRPDPTTIESLENAEELFRFTEGRSQIEEVTIAAETWVHQNRHACM